MTDNFTRVELEAIFTVFDQTNVRGIESNEIKIIVMKKVRAALQEDEKLKAGLAVTVKEPAK